MQHHVEIGPERNVLERRARGEETVLLGQEEARYSEVDAAFGLQCGESLAIAANRIGEEAFGVGQLLRTFTRSVEAAMALGYLVYQSGPSSGRSDK
ncbi:MAG: hypothetical protein LC740_07200 [Actinobacteria bacterium]|nr:hypothetical protein [Actinomycetota bacterium]